jgi:UDP-GlcNAc:undecaprenyl-phosphate/decaprenyl-phosphate GlcNAc-1-phosphate transferase
MMVFKIISYYLLVLGRRIYLAQTSAWYLLLIIAPFCAAIIITPLITKLALHYGVLDRPTFHKTHTEAKPLLGGVSIFISFALVVLIFLPMDKKLISIVVSTLIMVVTGLYDDLYDLKPLLKLSAQGIAASIVVFSNANLFRFFVEYFSHYNIGAMMVYLLVIGWVVLMINAFNIIDGIDGLAAGTAAIIFLAMAVLSFLDGGRANMLGVQLIGAGACLGFLLFNFNPAKVYMGDSGSMLLGFVLATVHLFTIKYPFSAQLVLGSIFIFAYPAFDISYAIYRRICYRNSLFKADKGHVHHVLLSLGISVKKTVIIIYMLNILFASFAILLMCLNISVQLLFLIGVVTIIFVIVLFKWLIIISKRNGISAK